MGADATLEYVRSTMRQDLCKEGVGRALGWARDHGVEVHSSISEKDILKWLKTVPVFVVALTLQLGQGLAVWTGSQSVDEDVARLLGKEWDNLVSALLAL
jgi:hypothetical protein